MLILILMPSLLLYSLLVTRFIKKTLNFFFGFLFFFPVPSASSLTPLLPTLVPSFSPKDIDPSLIHIKETRSSFLTSSFIIFKQSVQSASHFCGNGNLFFQSFYYVDIEYPPGEFVYHSRSSSCGFPRIAIPSPPFFLAFFGTQSSLVLTLALENSYES